jgi:hypothetical protein
MNGLMGALRVKRAVIVIGIIGVTVGMEKFIVVVRAIGVRSGVFGSLRFMCASGAVRVFGAECCWS